MSSTACLGERLDGPAWRGLPLGRFAPPGHDTLQAVAARQDTLFLWQDGASAAEVHTARGSQHYRRRDGVMDILAAGEEVRVRHEQPEAPGACLLIALEHEAGARRPQPAGRGHAIYSRFGLVQPELHRLATALLRHNREGQPLGRLYTESLSNALAAAAYGLYADGRRAGPALPALPAGAEAARRIARVLDHLRQQAASDLGLDELATLAGCSRAQFVRLFRRVVGESPHQHLIRLRIEGAQRLLRQSDRPLAEIAAACGFTDASHFSNCFSRWLGVSPSRFRTQARRG